MGLFDQLKNIAMKEANNLINDAKEKATDKIEDEVREQSTQVISDGMNTYLENAKEKVDTQEGKEAVERLQNLVQDQKEISNAASSLDSFEQDAAIKKTQEDLQKLVNMSSKIKNNSNNNQYRKEEHCKKN